MPSIFARKSGVVVQAASLDRSIAYIPPDAISR